MLLQRTPAQHGFGVGDGRGVGRAALFREMLGFQRQTDAARRGFDLVELVRCIDLAVAAQRHVIHGLCRMQRSSIGAPLELDAGQLELSPPNQVA